MGVYAITGGSSGIGAKTVELLKKAGHEVINIDLRDGDICVNLATPEGRQEAIDRLHELHPEGLVLAVGVGRGRPAGQGRRGAGDDVVVDGSPGLGGGHCPRRSHIGSFRHLTVVVDDQQRRLDISGHGIQKFRSYSRHGPSTSRLSFRLL